MTQQNPSEVALDLDIQAQVCRIAHVEWDVMYHEFARVNGLSEIDFTDPAVAGEATIERMEQFSNWVSETGLWFSAESIGSLVALKRAKELEPGGSLTFEELAPYLTSLRVLGAETLVVEVKASRSHIDVLLRRRIDG